jgi:hypothetical protein
MARNTAPMSAWLAGMLLAPSVTAAELDWLAGPWCGELDGERIEEAWLPPVDGESIGMSRSVRDGRTTSWEFVRIARIDGVLTYLAQPRGRPPTAFPRVGGGEDWIRFENAHHDFPQRIEYRQAGAGLRATISGPGKDGKRVSIDYAYTRCPAG